jgi:hypothetical protein
MDVLLPLLERNGYRLTGSSHQGQYISIVLKQEIEQIKEELQSWTKVLGTTQNFPMFLLFSSGKADLTQNMLLNRTRVEKVECPNTFVQDCSYAWGCWLDEGHFSHFTRITNFTINSKNISQHKLNCTVVCSLL